MTDYVNPKELLQEAVQLAKRKSDLPVRDMLIRGILAGAFLGYATSLVFVVLSQGIAPIVGAILFPVGFVILVLLGLELVTGNFALLPAGVMAGTVRVSKLLRNWGWVYLGNLIGSLLYAALFYAFVKAILCNWMVTIGAMLALISRSTVGKITAMWLPIMTFFALGFEHSVVNMYLIPSGMMFGAPISVGQAFLWNLLPVTLGNVVAGALLTGVALYATYPSEAAVSVATQIQAVTTEQNEKPGTFAAAAGLR